jgi:hypothetical protein
MSRASFSPSTGLQGPSETAASPRAELITPGRVAVAVALLATMLYLVTMNRTFGFIDKGELVAVASTLGIAHPTGYPTIMLIGFLFAKLLPLRPVLALNAMAALFTAAGAGMLALLFDDLLGRIGAARVTVSAKGKGKGRDATKRSPEAAPATAIDAGTRALLAGLAALFVACTATWWDQGNGFEVYSLHAVMMPLVTLLFLRWVDEERERDAVGFTRRGLLFALALGLSFTNHLTTILLAPAFLLHYFRTFGIGNARAWKRLLYVAPGFLLGLLPYIWLPIRASMGPWFNWGNPSTIEAFLNHVRGKQYSVWMFAGGDVFMQQSRYFFGGLPGELAYAGVVVTLLGIVHLALRNLGLSLLAALLFIACILYSGNYDIMEIGPYYMTAIFAAGIWFAAGLAWLHERFGRSVALGAASLLVVANCAANFQEGDESGNRLVEDMTVNMLTTLPKNALIFSSQWDYWVAGSFYMQRVEGMRPDVMLIDPELLRRVWYLDQLAHDYPAFMARIAPEVEAFRKEVYKFDHDLPYDPATIQGTYIGMMNAMIERSIGERPVCLTSEVDQAVGARYVRTPYYLSLRLMPDTSYLPQEFPSYRFSFWPGRISAYTAKTYQLYGASAVARMIYEARSGHPDLARKYHDLALGYDPGFTADRIPSLPLGSEDGVRDMIGFFDRVRGMR